jgi:pyridoxal phosphate enzyme (YggS family)
MDEWDIAQHWSKVRAAVPAEVQVIAVSKTKPISAVETAYAAGARSFGENRVQELVGKHEALTHPETGQLADYPDLSWHQIGTLQKNKVKYIAPFVGLIHAVDQTSLLNEIDKRAAANGRKISVLLQLHIAQESSKFGLSESELTALLGDVDSGHWPHVEIKGLMGMATFTEDHIQVAREFQSLRKLYEQFRESFGWDTLSMGMSGDWQIAVDNGSNMVRIGSSIFGHR